MAPRSLITIRAYKELMGLQEADTREDARIEAVIPRASRAIQSFTNRSFELVAERASIRKYMYEGDQILDIDDCTRIESLVSDGGLPGSEFVIQGTAWTAMPQSGSDVYYYILLNECISSFGISPEMGFTYNLDTIGYSMIKPAMISVSAFWGWPETPSDVELAVALTTSELMSTDSKDSDDMTAESIEGWSRAWGSRSSGVEAYAIPNRARDLLTSYQRLEA